MKGVIVHCKDNPRTVIMISIKRYMYLWHECLVMTKFPAGISVTVHNLTNFILDSGAMCHMTPHI